MEEINLMENVYRARIYIYIYQWEIIIYNGEPNYIKTERWAGLHEYQIWLLYYNLNIEFNDREITIVYSG